MDPAEYPTRVARQWIPPSIPNPAEYPLPVDPAEHPASVEPERLASTLQWIPPVSSQSSSPVWFCLMSRPAQSWVYMSCWCLLVLSRLADKWSLTHTDRWIRLSMRGLSRSHRPQATRKPCLNSHNRVHGGKLVRMEGGDCSSRSNLFVCLFVPLVG